MKLKADDHEKIKELYLEGASKGLLRWEACRAIADRFQVHPMTVRRVIVRAGLWLVLPRKRGAESPRWKGGRRKAADGYIQIYCLDHPFANIDGCVLEHRLIMEEKLGRYLNPWEIVHHKDGLPRLKPFDHLCLLT